MSNNKYNLYIFKYGVYIHTCIHLYLLYSVNLFIKSPVFWAFLINLAAMMYFVFVRGTSYGIKIAKSVLDTIEEHNKKEEDDYRNN